MSINKQRVGQLGERIAENFLKRKGYKIFGRNFSIRSAFGQKTGEIDLIVEKDKTISFVEVKTLAATPLSVRSFISPEEKVNFQKQKKLIKTAQNWLMRNKIPLNKKWQIDIIAIKIDLNSKKAKIRHFKNSVSG